jgi:uncharacterized iron-regulated protein
VSEVHGTRGGLGLGLALLLLAGCATRQPPLDLASPYVDPRTLRVGEILHLATGRLLAESEALDYLCRFPVVYVGEAHDNVEAHAVQLTVLKAMETCFPGQVALGLEMLQRPFQADADAFVRGEMSDQDFERAWRRSWGDISYYWELLHFAREKRIPLLALNASAAARKAVREQPPSAMTPDTAREMPEIDTQDPYYRAYVQAMMGGHTSGVGADAFYRVQLLWDETMAETAAEYLKSPAGRGRRLLLLAGSNHVRYGFGIPRRLFRRVPLPFVIVEPYVHGAGVEVPKDRLMEVDVPALPLRPADLYWSVRYRDLRGEQVNLGIRVEDADGAGVRVTGVLPGGPGHAAGLLAGDLIVSVDGTEVSAASDLIHEVSRHKRGESGTIEVLRGGARVPLPVTYDVPTHGR